MKRLTEYNSFGGVYGIGMGAGDNTEIINAILERLAAYEDAEAEGRLVVLPCKVGDTVYFRNGDRGAVTSFYHGKNPSCGNLWVTICQNGKRVNICYGDFGKTVFLTREEAEEALRRKTNERT